MVMHEQHKKSPARTAILWGRLSISHVTTTTVYGRSTRMQSTGVQITK